MKRRLVYTATNRPFYFRPVMQSWTQVRGYPDWQPTVFLEPTATAQAMTAIAHTHGAAVHHNDTRRGVLTNPWHALDTTFNLGADFVVLAEDDVLVSDDILEYFTWASETLTAAHVLAVCTFSDQPACPPELSQHVRDSQHFNPLIWGTWSDRWTGVLRDTWDHAYNTGTPEAPQAGWDWNINLRVMADWHIISPIASRSTHIGEAMGTHTTPHTYPDSIAATFLAHRPAAPFVLD